MRSLYLSLAVLALTLDLSDAIGSSGLLRERKEEHHRQLQTSKSKSGNKGGKGKGKSSSTLSPVCPGEGSSKSKGKGGKGSKSKSTNRFLEEVRQLNGKGKGKGKSSGGDDCDCDYPTDLCEDEDPTTVVCEQIITEDTVLSTSLGCDVGMGATVEWAITVDGATLECTGDGDNMIYNQNDLTSSDYACVILRNGATLKNCHIYNCGVGVLMQGEGNNRVVGSTFFGNAANVVTGANPLTPTPGPVPTLNQGCYSVECSKIVGSTGQAAESVSIGHGGDMIISNTDILGPMATAVRVFPDAGNVLAVAFDDVNIFGSREGNGRNVGIQVGGIPAGGTAFGTITEVGFYGQTKLVHHLYGLTQANVGAQGASPSIVVYGSLESYDASNDNFQVLDATLMLEDDSTLIACTPDQTPLASAFNIDPPEGVPIDIQAAGTFVDMGGDVTCQGGVSGSIGTAVACDDMNCPANPQTAFACSGDGSSSSKSKGKGGKGSKSKSSTP